MRAARKGNWHSDGQSNDPFIATKAFRSLQCVGPLPWHEKFGLMLPVPHDVAFERDPQKTKNVFSQRLRPIELQRSAYRATSTATGTGAGGPLSLPLALTPPNTHGQL